MAEFPRGGSAGWDVSTILDLDFFPDATPRLNLVDGLRQLVIGGANAFTLASGRLTITATPRVGLTFDGGRLQIETA